jgi:hypothetical protein
MTHGRNTTALGYSSWRSTPARALPGLALARIAFGNDSPFQVQTVPWGIRLTASASITVNVARRRPLEENNQDGLREDGLHLSVGRWPD